MKTTKNPIPCFSGSSVLFFESFCNYRTTVTGQKAQVLSHQLNKQSKILSSCILVNSRLAFFLCFSVSSPCGSSSMEAIVIQNIINGGIRNWHTLTLEFHIKGLKWFPLLCSTISITSLIYLGLHFVLRLHLGRLATVPNLYFFIILVIEVTGSGIFLEMVLLGFLLKYIFFFLSVLLRFAVHV